MSVVGNKECSEGWQGKHIIFCYDCCLHSMTTKSMWSQSAGFWLIHPLSVCTHIIKMRKFNRMIIYTMCDLCQIQRESRTEYNRFTLGYVLMSKIISMGIKRQPQDLQEIKGRMESFLSDTHHFQDKAGGSGPGMGHHHCNPCKSFTNHQKHHTRSVLYTITRKC